MRFKGTHKKSRPLGYDLWDRDTKIAWLKNRKKPTEHDKKELRFYEQQIKFEKFSKWLKKHRELEKSTESYKKKEQSKCAKNRDVSSCHYCCRYKNCIQGKPLYDSEEISKGELQLGHAIILSVEDAIKRCWEKGWKDQLEFWVKVLMSERTNILTADTVDGIASAQALVKWCLKHYGEFEPRYEKCQQTYKPVLEKLEIEQDKAKKAHKSKLCAKINEEITRVIKQLYGDTM